MRLLLCFLLAAVSFHPPDGHFAQAHLASPAASVELLALTDARISLGSPSSACGNETYLAVGYDRPNNHNQEIVRSLIKFDLTQLPERALVSKAELKLFFIDFSGPLLGTYIIGAGRVLEPWAENSVQWSTAPAIAADAPITATVNHQQRNIWISFDITEILNGWLQGIYPNYGLALFGMEETPSELSSVEFFESSEFTGEDSVHRPVISVTYATPLAPASPANDTAPWSAFLPVVFRSYPPDLDLHPIDNDSGEANYTITWSLHPKGAEQFDLFEWIDNQWQVIFTTTSGETSFPVQDKPLGTYSYYLKATGDTWTETSLVRSVTVSDQPNQMVYLVIGVSDYQNMLPPTETTPHAILGNDLVYPIFDATDVQDMLEVYGSVVGQPAEHALGLKNRQATKAAIQTAITSWMDARETASTTVFVYFAGHTLLSGDPLKPYLAPYDLACNPCQDPPAGSTWLVSSGISSEELNLWLGELASKRITFLFDSAESERWIAELKAAERTILAGSSIGEKRWEFEDIKNGAFSWYLTEAYIKNADQDQDGGISPTEVHDFTTVPPALYSFVYSHTINVAGGPYEQHAVLDAGSTSQEKFVNSVLPQACQPLR